MNFTRLTHPFGCPRVLANGLRGVLALSISSVAIAASATDYYVSTTGNDANNGSQTTPFRTISKGISIAQPGDGVIVRGGTYRESVVFPRSGASGQPIRLEAFSGEVPVINGCDVVSGWSFSGGKYSTSIGWDLGVGRNQMFVDGKALDEARLLYAGNDIIRPLRNTLQSATVSSSGTGSLVTIRSTDLQNSSNALVGARILANDGLYGLAIGGTVVSNDIGTLTFQTSYPIPYTFLNGNNFTLFGLSWFADKAGESCRSGSSLTFVAPFTNTITAHLIEVKKRPIGLDLSGRSFVSIDGIRLFGCRLKTTDTSGNITVQNLWSKYAGHNIALDNPFADPDPGIEIRGTNNTLRNAVVEFSSGAGVTLGGSGNTVCQVQVHDVDYAASNVGGIDVTGQKHTVQFCSVYNAGRAGILHSGATTTAILNNDIFAYCTLTTDCGGTYTWQTDGGNGVVAYNTIHDAHNDGPGLAGVMLDNGSRNFRVHHNVVWNTDHGLHISPPNAVVKTMPGLVVVGNTFDSTRDAVWMDNFNYVTNASIVVSRDFPGVVIANNASTVYNSLPSDAVVRNDLGGVTASDFTNLTAHDYRPSAGSSLVDTGLSMAPANYVMTGSAPDIGALEQNQTMFLSGAKIGFGPVPTPIDVKASTGLRRVTVSWSARPYTYYNVYRSNVGASTYALIANNVTTTSYDDFSVDYDRDYDYVVTTTNGQGESGFSASCTARAYSSISLHGLVGEYSLANDPGNTFSGLLFGVPTMRRLDANVDFDWQMGSPDPSITPDNFAVIWTGFVTAPVSGTYTFSTSTDNGVRLWVNNQLLVDHMTGSVGSWSGTVTLQAGEVYPIRMEYSEGTGNANAHLYWTLPGGTSTVVPTDALTPSSGAGVEAAYYNDSVLTFGLFSSLAGVVMDDLNGTFDLLGSLGVNLNFWSCHERGQVMAPVDGNYTFQMSANSAMKVVLNGQVLANKWNDTNNTATATVALQGGKFYDIQYDFAQGLLGTANRSITWSFAGQPTQAIPVEYLFPPLDSSVNGITAKFYSDGSFGNLVATKVYDNVNVNWPTAPVSGVGTTGYSVKWSGRITPDATQSKAFKVDAVGRVKLTINGKVLIDNTSSTAWSLQSKFIALTAGTKYDIQMEYAPGSSPGNLKLSWVTTGPAPTLVVPKSSLTLNYGL